MTQSHSALFSILDEVLSDPDFDHLDVFRRILQAGLQELVDAEAEARIGAGRFERSAERQTYRNGTRSKTVTTPSGQVQVQIPKLRQGSFFPSLLCPRRRVDKALYAVICQAWINGVSTRKVDALIKALGNESGISKATVSRICGEIDEVVTTFTQRPLDHTWFPYIYLDGTYLDVRHHGRVVSQALIVATGVSIAGRREILGMALGDSETTDFWTNFLRSLRERGLKVATKDDPTGVALVISDAHAGLKAAVKATLPFASWQRCRVHFARNVTSLLGSTNSKPVNALISTIFAQPSQETVTSQYHSVTATLRPTFPGVADMLEQAQGDLTAFATFPTEHWRKIWSNNPIERLNREIKRRADVVQIFPDQQAVTRLVGALLCEQHEEWCYSERRYLSEISMKKLIKTLTTTEPDNTIPAQLLTA